MAFPTTRWTFVRHAAGAPTVESRAAREVLCQTYAGSVVAFVRRRVALIRMHPTAARRVER
jgi:hypothetical protein